MHLIMINPGHGGAASGAVVDGVQEKDLNLAVSLELAQVLATTWSGFIPILTRYTDITTTLKDCCFMEHTYAPACFVSIHFNAATSEYAKGFEVFTTKGETPADSLASKVFEEVVLKFPNMALRPDYSDADPDKEENFAVLRGTNCPAILVECAFLSNKEELAQAVTRQFQSNMAAAIAFGITRWVVETRGPV